MVALSWDQVNTWRLSQHHLLERGRRQMLDVVTHIGGVQAQLMSAAELALGARVDEFLPQDVQNALWRDRSLIKTWIMRGTLHLLTASEFSLYVAARSTQLARIRRPPSYYRYHGVTPAELDAIIQFVPKVLTDNPMTREQLADALARQADSPGLHDVLLSGWGALLKPSAFRGDVCFGPNQGQNVTFVHPRRWIEASPPVDPEAALKEIARRYLAAYGPVMPEDFARWWGFEGGPAPAKKLFRSLGDEIEMVDVEGWQAWTLASAVAQMKAIEATHMVRLLPQFDAYVVGLPRDCVPVLPEAYKGRVYRPQGWISAVLLVDGRMEGVWEYEVKSSRITVKVEMFASLPTADIQRGIEAEAQRLGSILGGEVELTYTNA